MILIFTPKITSRITYVCKHIFTRILGVEVSFTNTIEAFLSFDGVKLSYGKQPLGNEFFIKSHNLLQQQGVESIDISVKEFKQTKCFFQTKDAGIFPFDIFAASFYLLSRYEEYLPHVKDAKGRFSAKESLGYKHQFLKQPVVDIWALELKKMLSLHYPHLEFSLKKKQKQHILIDASQPFQFQQKGIFRGFVATMQDLFQGNFKNILSRIKVLVGVEKDPYNTFEKLILLSKKSKTPMTFFFLLGQAATYENGVNVHRKKFKLLVKLVGDYKKVGAVFSNKALFDYNTLRSEKQKLESITNTPLTRSMNTEVQLNLPDTYRDLVSLEITKDFTMTYPNKIGFRAGTCTPFLFYDLDYEIITPLELHPVAITTQALSYLSRSSLENEVQTIQQAIKEVDGHLNVLFKNSDFTHKKWAPLVTQLFKNML